ncbi:MAG: membrane protein insertion efficiency factor YidD [Alphaproteobacteria bacterium]|nr:membrane protein insertion efficiency factor YidD [Alphaproteobacteria bacterium]
MNPISVILRGAIRLYQLTIPAITGPSCRFEPSCSEYAREAIAIHGPLAGLGLAVRRIARCHPWGGSGWDPVPPAASSRHESSHHEACGHRH